MRQSSDNSETTSQYSNHDPTDIEDHVKDEQPWAQGTAELDSVLLSGTGNLHMDCGGPSDLDDGSWVGWLELEVTCWSCGGQGQTWSLLKPVWCRPWVESRSDVPYSWAESWVWVWVSPPVLSTCLEVVEEHSQGGSVFVSGWCQCRQSCVLFSRDLIYGWDHGNTFHNGGIHKESHLYAFYGDISSVNKP